MTRFSEIERQLLLDSVYREMREAPGAHDGSGDRYQALVALLRKIHGTDTVIYTSRGET